MEESDRLYSDAADEYGSALERLARAYEADAEKRRDLLQEVHFQLCEASSGSTLAVRLEPGSIAWRTMWPRRT